MRPADPSSTLRREAAPFVLADEDEDRLAARLDLAVQRARRAGRPTLASITLPLPQDVDPSAVVCASRRPGEPWSVFEQPERKAVALATLGEVTSLRRARPGALRRGGRPLARAGRRLRERST